VFAILPHFCPKISQKIFKKVLNFSKKDKKFSHKQKNFKKIARF
jgi:hypothetical protein